MAAGKVKRAQTAGEELANTLSHGFGAEIGRASCRERV